MDKPKILRRDLTSNSPRISKTVIHFQADRLPPARSFYELELGRISRPNHKGWAMGRCPFHESKAGKYFSVNLDSGGFHCFGCDAKGGDIVSFLRLRDGLSFKEACQQLGAWDDAAQPTPLPPTILVNHLVMDFDVDDVHHRAEVKDEPRNYAQKIRRFHREAGAQLEVPGPEQAGSDEAETYWTRLALGLDELREAGIYE
jgi:CHC2 zinc finger